MPASSSQNADRMMPVWEPSKVAWAVHVAAPGMSPSRLADGAGDTSVCAPLVLVRTQVERKEEKELARSILGRFAGRCPDHGAADSAVCTNQIVCRPQCLSIYGKLMDVKTLDEIQLQSRPVRTIVEHSQSYAVPLPTTG
jgi:hypothetical protein